MNEQLLNTFYGKHVVLSLRDYDTDEVIWDRGMYGDLVQKWKLHPETVVKLLNETGKPFFIGGKSVFKSGSYAGQGYFGRISWDGEEQIPPIPYLVSIYPAEPLEYQKSIIEEYKKILPFGIRSPEFEEKGIAEKKTVYIAGMPEAVKDNRARMLELGNLIREGGTEYRRAEYRLPIEQIRGLALNIKSKYKLPNIYLGGSQSPKSKHYPKRTSDIDLFSYFDTYEQLENYARTVGKDTMELLTFVPRAGLAGQEAFMGRKVMLSISFMDLKPENLGEYDDQILLDGGNLTDIAQKHRIAEKKTVYIAGMPEAVKDNRVRMLELGNLIREGGHAVTARPQKEPWQMTKEEFAKTAIPLPDRKDFVKAWLKDNEEIPELVKPGFNYIEQRNGSLLVFGNQGGQAIGIISFRQDAVEHIAVSDRYKNKGIATQLLEESKKYGVLRVIGAISPEVAGIVHRFAVKTAFMGGKPVPSHVLREYPDLMMKAEKQRWRRV